MLRNVLIILSALLLALGLTVGLYREEVDQMIGMIQDDLRAEESVESEEGDRVKEDSILIDTSAVQLTFGYGEAFTAEGLKVIVVMSDGSTKEVSLTDCKIVEPDTTQVGKRQVVIAYGGFTARYEVTVGAKVFPPVSVTPLAELKAENGTSPYRVEAEKIDMAVTGAIPANGAAGFVASSQENGTSGGKYLTDFGVSRNYFGFTFVADKAYENATVVLRVLNPTKTILDMGNVRMYLNFEQNEQGDFTGEILLDGYTLDAGDSRNWKDIVIRNLTVKEGTNVLAFEVLGPGEVFDLDYVDIYAGSNYVSSFVELTDTNLVICDIEKMDTEKAFTRQDVADNLGLGQGELCIATPSKVPAGKTTHGGTCVDAIGKGSQLSTTLRLAQDATVFIRFKAAAAGRGDYYVSDHWNFYIDGIKLATVEHVDIEGGDAAAGIWWDWNYTNIGAINLPAGDHLFMLEIVGTDCNVDTIEFEVISLGSFDGIGVGLEDMDDYENAAKDEHMIAGTGTTKIEMEELDLSLSDIVTRSDFIPAVGEGNVGKGDGRIYGYDNGTTFRMKIKVMKACTLQVSLAGFGNPMNQYTYKLGDEVITPQGNYGSGAVAEGVIGTVVVTEPGVYVFEFTSGIGCDLDYVAFTVIE